MIGEDAMGYLPVRRAIILRKMLPPTNKLIAQLVVEEDTQKVHFMAGEHRQELKASYCFAAIWPQTAEVQSLSF